MNHTMPGHNHDHDLIWSSCYNQLLNIDVPTTFDVRKEAIKMWWSIEFQLWMEEYHRSITLALGWTSIILNTRIIWNYLIKFFMVKVCLKCGTCEYDQILSFTCDTLPGHYCTCLQLLLLVLGLSTSVFTSVTVKLFYGVEIRWLIWPLKNWTQISVH